MTTMASEGRATVVYLRGPTREPFSFALGKYERSVEMCQQRHVYTSPDDERALWWADGAWYLGSKGSVGKRSGFLTAKENTDVPEDIAVAWSSASADNGWVDCQVECITEEVHTRAVAESLANASAVVYLSGTLSGGVNAICLGAYARQPGPLISDRHTYLKEVSAVGPLMMWSVGGSWYVGQPADVGTRRGLLTVEDDSVVPEKVTAT